MVIELPDAELTHVISEAAFDATRWVDVCDGLARLSHADGGVIIPIDVAQRAIGLPQSAPLADFITKYQAEGWYRRDLRERGIPVMRQRGYMTDADCISYSEIEHSEFYQDFLRPVGLRWFVGINIQVGGKEWCLTLQRGLNREPFEQQDIDLAVAYSHLLSSSAEIAQQIGFARLQGATSALERHGLGALAFDSGGRIVHINPPAEHHLADCLRISGRRLYAADSAQQMSLDRLVRSICMNDATMSGRQVYISRSGVRKPLVVYGCKLPEGGRDIFGPAVGLLVISDPDRILRSTPELYGGYFGLTPTESQIAVHLSDGGTVADYAEAHAITLGSARQLVKSVLHKTGTHRQAELVALISSYRFAAG